MYNLNSEKYLKNHEKINPVDINDYIDIIGREKVERIKELALPLKGKVWAQVNSTFEGGGVAEMLKSTIPLALGLGIDAQWYCLEAYSDNFFNITKKFHDLIQGVDVPFTVEEIHGTYIEDNKKNFENYKIKADFITVHDPQPLASVVFGDYEGPMLWRCHIDTTSANPYLWNFLVPYINHFEGAIFTDKNFVREGIKKPVYLISPSIDPLKSKNKQLSEEKAWEILEPLFEANNIDKNRPIALAVSRYDIHKNQTTIIEAFKHIKNDEEVKKKNPILIIVGNTATDDPDGIAMYGKMMELRENDPDIYLLMNIENNDENIGALMRVANHFVHVSTKEGFGLVVTEALWHGTPVIGSNVGGIAQQVIDKETGFLVDPMDVETIGNRMKHFLLNPQECEILGRRGMEHIRENFLMPSLLEKYLILMRYYTGIDKEMPQFILD